jgi:hypothetical protein
MACQCGCNTTKATDTVTIEQEPVQAPDVVEGCGCDGACGCGGLGADERDPQRDREAKPATTAW